MGLKLPIDFIANRRVILCNQLCILTIANTLLFEILFAEAGNYMLMLVHSTSIFFYVMVLWLNKKGYFSLAKQFLLFTVGIEIFIVTLLLGTATGIHIYFFPLICAVLILFEYSELKKALLIVFIYLFLTLALYIPFGQHIWQIDISSNLENLLFISTLFSSLLLTILCVYHLVRANQHVEEDLRIALYAQGKLNQELLIREEELKANLNQLSLLSRAVTSEKAKLSAIVENFEHFICCIDREYRLIYCNTNYQKLFKGRFGRQLQVGDRLLDFFTPDVTARWQVLYDRALAGEKFIKEVQGQSLIHEAYFSPIAEENNEIIGITVFMQNISARKAAEREIIAAKEVAEQATRAKSDFLSNMSHEIRTPMNAVIGLTHLLIDQNPRPEQLELLQVLRFSSENLLSIINDILDLQKIEAGKIVFEQTDFNIQELLHNLIHSMQFKAQEKKLKLMYVMDAHLPELLMGDSVRLSQILNNLLSNAIKFTESGSVTLQVKLLQQDQEECMLFFSVKDTGIGIAKDKLQVIFNPFEQAEPDITRKYGGTGLGLSITKKLIELQKGTLEVESKIGAGATFYFSLPYRLGSSSPNKVLQLPHIQRVDLSHIRLLLVEDNMINMMVASKFLQKWNIVADHAEDGKDALNKVQQKDYDLVLMDLQMPVMNGFEASREIRKLAGIYKNLPIVALTADVSGDVQHKVLEAGMNAYLSKPFVEEELYTTIFNLTNNISQLRKVPETGHRKEKIAVQPVKSFSVDQVVTLAAGDKQFIYEIILACQNNLDELQSVFPKIMFSRNREALRSIKHKLKTCTTMFELHTLQTLLEQSSCMLQHCNTTDEDLHKVCAQLEKECLLVKEGLKQYMDSSKQALVIYSEDN